MRLENLLTVWATSPVTTMGRAENVTAYTRLRRAVLNVQTDYSHVDVQTYGQTISELIKLRSDAPPDIAKGDRLYLHEPELRGAVEIKGVAYEDYGPGDYRVEAVRTAFLSGAHPQNPTTIEAVKVTK